MHDITEDVEGYNRITLEKLFNANIARLVQLLTKEHNKDYRIPSNLIEYISLIKTDANASAIKTADRMHNIMTLNQKSFLCRQISNRTINFYHRNILQGNT